MGIETRMHNSKAKINNDTKDETFSHMQKPGTHEDHTSMTSNFNFIKDVISVLARNVLYIMINRLRESINHMRRKLENKK